MPFILTRASFIICPHGGRLVHEPTSPSLVLIDGQVVYFHDDRYFIDGCRSGCAMVEWSNHFPHIIIQGSRHFLTNESLPWCKDSGAGFKGYGIIMFFQMKVTTEAIMKDAEKKN